MDTCICKILPCFLKKKSIGHDFRATDLINSPEPTERDTSGKNSMYK